MALFESRSFSALVDDVILRSGRTDRRNDVISYARMTIRECEALSLFTDNTIEEILMPTSDPFVWPRPINFRIMQTVQYQAFLDEQGIPLYPRQTKPGRNVHFYPHGWYPSGNSLVFFGCANSPILLYYYTFLPVLTYFPKVADRPARYLINDETGAEMWNYKIDYATTPEKQLEGRALVQHWMLERWYDTMLEGTLAKIYKLVGDERASLAYSLYKSFQENIMLTEPHDELG